MIQRPITALASLTVAAVTALTLPLPLFANDEVNVYSARQEALIKPLMDEFTEETGIRVNIVSARADTLLQRLRSEGRNTPADVLITVDAGNLHNAKEAGVLRPVDSEVLKEAIPESLRDPEGYWYGLSMRARPIMYVTGEVDPEQLSTYEALADEQWQQRICIRSSSNVYNQSLVASMIIANGEEETEEWARGLVANMAQPPRGGDRDQIRAAVAGVCDIAIANTYYLGQMLNSDDDTERATAEAISVFWPNQEGRGAHVNVSGAGLITHTENVDNAVKLLEFMASDRAQQWYAEANQEYPVKPGVEWSDTLSELGDFKPDAVNLGQLGEYNAEAVRLMDRANWR
ncbi:Fe(3+) ABC transporter substrate-binding protein [Ectothiorhodospira marina]|jgi:iron(III) transport system substrate-binding protein|uniref:Iron(III) transport system substrate-binding protein n=1 Tax=Ectothiorhodospira marina TaxID=1396821 RepID=A0A1H7H107_9GAMM|nr:Fe(3+) ABC transporter substrate-binding protein [Ectothiorhodospira marina]SEK43979.1 iron(III) transport system substrate-binding protein [Ectothiorhodospira marina]